MVRMEAWARYGWNGLCVSVLWCEKVSDIRQGFRSPHPSATTLCNLSRMDTALSLFPPFAVPQALPSTAIQQVPSHPT